MKVIDSSAWIEFSVDGPLAGRIEHYLKDKEPIMTPTIILYEVYKKLKRDVSEAAADAIAVEIAKTHLVNIDSTLALFAADTSLEKGLAMADALVYAAAISHGATLITCDADFKDLPHVIYLKKP